MYNLLKQILPEGLKDRLNRFAMTQLQQKLEAQNRSLPYVNLGPEQLSHTQVLLNREQLLERLPAGAVVAEVGVDQGLFSEQIIRITRPQKLHLIDLWGSIRFPDRLMEEIKKRYRTEIEAGAVEVHQGYSTDVGKEFPDHYFDWVYIDTDHSYATTRAELEVYSRKVKPGGIIAGHDFILGNWSRGIRYGVIEAVYEFCRKENWEILYLTMENGFPPSFGIRKIG